MAQRIEQKNRLPTKPDSLLPEGSKYADKLRELNQQS